MQRRRLLTTAATLGLGTWGMSGCAMDGTKHMHATMLPTRELAKLEAMSGGRLGLFVRDTATGQQAGWRSQERFPLCSTFKTLLAGHALNEVQRGRLPLDRTFQYRKADLVPWSPITEKHVDTDAGMTLQQLCEAAVVVSDNTAANLLLKATGGPEGLTAWLRLMGDHQTRLDRFEPELNTAVKSDERDTTTPAAMLGSLQKLLIGTVLPEAERNLLLQWLMASRTGDKRLRAGMPADWKAGGKTGSGENGTANDTLIVWPTPKAKPLLVTAYFTGSQLDAAERDAVLAQVGDAVKRWYLAL